MIKESTFAAMSAVKAARRANNVEEFVEHVTNSPVRPKNKGLIVMQQTVHKTGKPCCSDYGIINPIKFNLSESTLAKLRSLK